MQSQQAGTTKSPRSQSSAARSPAGANGGLERRPSATTQSHYRQASRAHGNFQQSRNAMFLNSPATSPMSPDTPGSAPNVGLPDISSLTMLRRGDSLRHPSESSAITLNGSTHSPISTLAEDRDVVDMNNGTMPQKRLERTQTSKRPRGHSHHRSQSKHQQEQKTVGEYALHHLFQRVSGKHAYCRDDPTNTSDSSLCRLIKRLIYASVLLRKERRSRRFAGLVAIQNLIS